MSMAFFSAGHGTCRTDPAPATSISSAARSLCAIGSDPPTLKTWPLHASDAPGAQERVHGVVDVHEIANLRAVAENLDLAPFERETDEPADKSLTVVPDELPRPVHVGEPQRARAHVEHVVVEQVVVFARRLVDAVDVDRSHQMTFGDRQRVGLSVHLARSREHHLHRRIEFPARLENRQLAAAVDLEIGVGILHAVDVAHLAGEVEDDLAIANQVVHGAFLADVGDVDANFVGDAVDVEEIRARSGNERVHQQHVGAELDEAVGDVAADEAEATRNHHAAAAIERLRRRRHSTRCPALLRDVSSTAGAGGR